MKNRKEGGAWVFPHHRIVHRHFVGRRQNLWDTNGSGGGSSSLGEDKTIVNMFPKLIYGSFFILRPKKQQQHKWFWLWQLLRRTKQRQKLLLTHISSANYILASEMPREFFSSSSSDLEPSSVSLEVIKRKRGWGVKLEAYAAKIGDTFYPVLSWMEYNQLASSKMRKLKSWHAK